MDSLLPFFLLCFTSFFTLTNPLGTMPVFLTMTNGMSEEQRRAIVRRSHNRVVPDADGFHFLRAVLVQVLRYFDKRVPYCGWHYHLHDRFRHVAGALCES